MLPGISVNPLKPLPAGEITRFIKPLEQTDPRFDVYPPAFLKAAIVNWWNGYSGVLDLTNPDARTWFSGQLDHLVTGYGVDGFKFDAGDARYYADTVVSRNPAIPNDHTKLFGQTGLRYPLNEYRASFNLAGRQLVQRLFAQRLTRHQFTQAGSGGVACVNESIVSAAGASPVSFVTGLTFSSVRGSTIGHVMG